MNRIGGKKVLGDKLLELRKNNGYTQIEISKKLNIQQTTYSKYEKGQRQPDYEILKKIANLYGVTTDFLLERTEEIENDITYYNNLLTNEEKERLLKMCELMFPNIKKKKETK